MKEIYESKIDRKRKKERKMEERKKENKKQTNNETKKQTKKEVVDVFMIKNDQKKELSIASSDMTRRNHVSHTRNVERKVGISPFLCHKNDCS